MKLCTWDKRSLFTGVPFMLPRAGLVTYASFGIRLNQAHPPSLPSHVSPACSVKAKKEAKTSAHTSSSLTIRTSRTPQKPHGSRLLREKKECTAWCLGMTRAVGRNPRLVRIFIPCKSSWLAKAFVANAVIHFANLSLRPNEALFVPGSE